ncbi:MAG: hypothetical protein GX333_02505 [Syntrophomonadaceae bacterium]|nr:hypothetical protein [Syntrophomonadaceae bacterium]
MNMLASIVNSDNSLFNLSSKPLPKPKNQIKTNFAKVLNDQTKPKENLIKTNTDKGQNVPIKEAEKSEADSIEKLDDFLEKNSGELEVPPELSKAELKAIIGLILEEVEETELVEEEIIAYVNAELAKIVITENKADNSEKISTENPRAFTEPANQPNLVNVIKENTEEKQTANRNISHNVHDEPEIITNNKAEEKPKNFRLQNLINTQLTKEDSASKTDIKKLISTEVGKLNNLKTTEGTTSNNQLATEAKTPNTVENEQGANLNLNKAELNNVRSDSRIVLVDNKPVEVKEVIDQIVKKAELVLKQNVSEIRINLKPEFLGKMTIRIAVEQGLVTARFITENLQVKHLLESNLNTLRQSLESQGIKVERTEVNVQLNNGGMFDGSETKQEWDFEKSGFNNYQANGEIDDNYEVNPYLEEEAENLTGIDYYQLPEDTTVSFLI